MEHESMRERKGVGTILRAGAAMALVAALAACGGGDGDAGANQETEMSDTPSLAERISMANAAAGQLDNESDAAAVENARGLITAAQEAIDALPGTDQAAEDAKLAGSISLVEGQEARVERDGEISGAIAAAVEAAEGLTDESDGAAVGNARGLITTAQTQIDRLPSDEQAARALITAAEGLKADAALLATAEASVSGHERRLDLATANAAIKKATDAVNGINNDSDPNAVTGAENEIKAAENVVAGLNKLSDEDKEHLSNQIASAQSNLDTRKSARVTAIAAKAAEDAKARTAEAKALYDQLTGAGATDPAGDPAASRPGGLTSGSAGDSFANRRAAYAKAVKADNGIGTEEKAHVLLMNNQGAQVETETPPQNAPASSASGSDVTDNGDSIAKYVRGSGFATGTETKTHKNTDEIVGTFAGAAGTYTCVTGCSSQVHSDGIKLIGTWQWVTDLSEPKYKVDDPAYAEFGVWLDDGLGSGAKVGAWYHREEGTAITDADITRASGTATYSGNAVGQAAFYDGTTSAENVGGPFTADATLNADFDDNTLSGTINNFDIEGVKPKWSVELMERSIVPGMLGVDAGDAPGTKWTADGTTAEAGGDWSADFYDMPGSQRTPKGVTGGFLADHGDEGEMVGAFGAER